MSTAADLEGKVVSLAAGGAPARFAGLSGLSGLDDIATVLLAST